MYTYNPMIVILIPSSSWKREKFVLSWDNKGDLAALNVMAQRWTRALPSWLFYLACLTAVCHLYIVHYRRQPCFCCAFIEVVFISLYLRDLLKTLIHKKTLIWFMVFFKTNRNWLGWEQGLDTSLHPPKFKAIQLKASISYLGHKKTTIAVGKGHAACSGMGAAGSGKWFRGWAASRASCAHPKSAWVCASSVSLLLVLLPPSSVLQSRQMGFCA